MIKKKNQLHVIGVGGGERGKRLLTDCYNICNDIKVLNFAGFVMDRPTKSAKNPRYTYYKEFDRFPHQVSKLASKLGVPVYKERINGSYKKENGFSKFHRWLADVVEREPGDWEDLRIIFIMACYGQRWTAPTIDLAKGWFINTHPNRCGEPWCAENPYLFAQPYENMLLKRRALEKRSGGKLDTTFDCELVAHLIDHTWDNGPKLLSMGREPLVKYNGKLSYERSNPNSLTGGKIICRPHGLGKVVYQMHKKMAPWTGRIAEAILTNQHVIEAIFNGEWATAQLISEIFPESGGNESMMIASDTPTCKTPCECRQQV